MSDDGSPAAMAEGDNCQVAVEEQDVVKRVRCCCNVPQGSVVRSADIHKLKLTIVARMAPSSTVAGSFWSLQTLLVVFLVVRINTMKTTS
jgi:hypothetical protein